jgi:hypothetical protein
MLRGVNPFGTSFVPLLALLFVAFEAFSFTILATNPSLFGGLHKAHFGSLDAQYCCLIAHMRLSYSYDGLNKVRLPCHCMLYSTIEEPKEQELTITSIGKLMMKSFTLFGYS